MTTDIVEFLTDIFNKKEKNSFDINKLCLYTNLTLTDTILLVDLEREYLEEYRKN